MKPTPKGFLALRFLVTKHTSTSILRYKETHVISKKAKYKMATKSKSENKRRSGEKMEFSEQYRIWQETSNCKFMTIFPATKYFRRTVDFNSKAL